MLLFIQFIYSHLFRFTLKKDQLKDIYSKVLNTNFYKLDAYDDPVHFHLNNPEIIQKIFSLGVVILEKKDTLIPFKKLIIDGNVFNYEDSMIFNGEYVQLYSRGWFKKEIMYVTFRGNVSKMQYEVVKNELTLFGDLFLRIIYGVVDVVYEVVN